MLSGAETEEPWFALSKDKYQTILNRALSEMEDTPALPPSTIISNCSELIKLLNEDDGLGSGSTCKMNGGLINRGGGISNGSKRNLDGTGISSAVVIAEKVPRRSAEINTGRMRFKTNDHGTVKGEWKYTPTPCCPLRLGMGKANSRIEGVRDVAKRKSVAWRANTETFPIHHPLGTGVKLESTQYTAEARTRDLSLNKQHCMTSSTQRNTNSKYPLRIPKAFNLCPHDNGGKYCSAGAAKCYTTRSSMADGPVLNELLTVDIKSIPNIDLNIPMLVPGNGLEKTLWESSHCVSGKLEPVDGATVKVENMYPVKEQPTQDNSSTIHTGPIDLTSNFHPICFSNGDNVQYITELNECPDGWSSENSVSAGVLHLTDEVMTGDSDVRHHSFDKQLEVSMQLRSEFSTGTDNLERHGRRFGDRSRFELKQNSEGAETPVSWTYRTPGFGASCLYRSEPQVNPATGLLAAESQRHKDAESAYVAKALHIGTPCFSEGPRPLLTEIDEETTAAEGKTGQSGVPSKRVQQLWAVVDKAVVSSMMEKILIKDTNDISAKNLEEATTNSCVEIERALDLFEIRPVPYDRAALLSYKVADASVENSADFPYESEPTDQKLNIRPTFLNSCEQLRDLVSDDAIGDVNVYSYSGSECCQPKRSDYVITFGAGDVRSEDSFLYDISAFEATLLDDLKLRGGTSANSNGRPSSCDKVESKLVAGNGAKVALNDVMVDATRVDMSRMSFKWKSNILRRLRNDQVLGKKWCLSGTLLA